MTTRHFITFGLFCALFGCGSKADKNGDNRPVIESVASDTLANVKASSPDTSNQYIYDFMKVVITDQKLDLSYGLDVSPEQGCDLSQGDKAFLKTLLIEKTNSKKDTGDWRNITITINQLPKCLTKGDMEEMLSQKDRLANFTWDNTRLGFNLSNNKNWYCFSRPLFSVDKQKAVIMIRNLCPGLCGTGWTLVFTKQNNKWTSQTGGQWIH